MCDLCGAHGVVLFNWADVLPTLMGFFAFFFQVGLLASSLLMTALLAIRQSSWQTGRGGALLLEPLGRVGIRSHAYAHTMQVIEGIFKAYFEQGKNLGSHDVLSSVAKEAGLDEEPVRVRYPRVVLDLSLYEHEHQDFGAQLKSILANADLSQER
jgi:hypothetical protein